MLRIKRRAMYECLPVLSKTAYTPSMDVINEDATFDALTARLNYVMLTCNNMPATPTDAQRINIQRYTEQLHAYFDAYSECDCCARHLTARPTSILDQQRIPAKPERVEHDCTCYCRTSLRNIVSAYAVVRSK